MHRSLIMVAAVLFWAGLAPDARSAKGGQANASREYTYDPVYPQSWGAKGNGVTDDTAAIQAAFAAAGSSRELFFPPGIYLVSDTAITVTASQKGVSIRGVPGQSVLLNKAGANTPTIKLAGARHFRISDLVLIGASRFPNEGISIGKDGAERSSNGVLNGISMATNGVGIHIQDANTIEIRDFKYWPSAQNWGGTADALARTHGILADGTSPVNSIYIYNPIIAYAETIANGGASIKVDGSSAGGAFFQDWLIEGGDLERTSMSTMRSIYFDAVASSSIHTFAENSTVTLLASRYVDVQLEGGNSAAIVLGDGTAPKGCMAITVRNTILHTFTADANNNATSFINSNAQTSYTHSSAGAITIGSLAVGNFIPDTFGRSGFGMQLTGPFNVPEGSAPSGAAGQDALWADSAAHRFKMNNNNGGADTVVGAATTDAFTNKTFNTAGVGNLLQINGTAITAITGSGAVVLANSPKLTTPNIGNAVGSISGNAATATALAADPLHCTANDFARGINSFGEAQCAQPSFSNLSGAATSDQLPTAELKANRDVANGYAGLTAGAKLNAAQGQKVWALADLRDVTATTGAGSTVMLNEAPALKSYAVADLPPAGTADRIAIVTDAATTGSCTAGGGTYRSLCRDTGSAWEPLGDGGGAGGGTSSTTASNLDSAAMDTAQIPSADGIIAGGAVSLGQTPGASSNPSNIRIVGPGGYSTIQEALNTFSNVPSSQAGGTIYVMPNYSEALTSSISIATESTTIEFLGSAVLTMGTYSVQIAPGLRNVAIRGSLPWGGYSGSAAPAVTLDYQGTGAAIQVGDPSALTENVVIENLNLNLAQAGANAVAIDAIFLQRYQFNCIRVNGGAEVTQIGIRVQGGSAAGHWSGSGVISLPYILMRSPGSIGVQYGSLGRGPTNQNAIRGGTILGTVNSAAVGVNYVAPEGRGNFIDSLAIKGFQQGVRYAGGSAGNALFGGTFNSNAVDVQFDSGANTNEAHGANVGNGGLLTAINNGANNIVWSGGTIVSGFLIMSK